CLSWIHGPRRGGISHTMGWHCDHLRGGIDRRPHTSANHWNWHNKEMIATKFVFLLVIVASGTAGDLCVARAMRRVGEVMDFGPSALVRVLGRAARSAWMWAGIGLMAVAFFALLAMLAVEDVSFVVPVTALSYVAGAIGGRLFLGERVGLQRSLGVFLVCIGVTLVLLGKG